MVGSQPHQSYTLKRPATFRCGLLHKRDRIQMAFHAGIHDKALPVNKPAAHNFEVLAYVRMQRRTGSKRAGAALIRCKSKPGWFHPGRCKRMWCGRGDLNPHDLLGSADFLTTSAFAAPSAAGSWSGLYLHHPARVRCCPSSLYTFPEFFPGLARDCLFRFPRL